MTITNTTTAGPATTGGAAPHTTTADEAAPHRTAVGTAATGATTAGGTVVDSTGARTGEAAEVIACARERIDTLDDRIIGLIQERTAVSAVIQQTRIESGGRRVNLSREMDVLAHYRDALGRPGTALAMTLLELCRGRV
ncbi:chorismate mutase [Streptomyces sp. NPDC057438]|uniref:chorismate mutase n=1 Tax=Streptomyces sp. NPDC057438 TaxID=3346133 RepID=UPI0036C6FDE0